jgi:hypothetical protein
MAPLTHCCVLGAHRILSAADGFDAADLLLRDASTRIVVFGLRTAEYLARPAPLAWDGYVPLAADADLSAVGSWDFDEVLWVGPAAWPCLVWTNAEWFSLAAVSTLFSPTRPNKLLEGPGGRGLPTPADLGLSVPAPARWVELDAAAFLPCRGETA